MAIARHAFSHHGPLERSFRFRNLGRVLCHAVLCGLLLDPERSTILDPANSNLEVEPWPLRLLVPMRNAAGDFVSFA